MKKIFTLMISILLVASMFLTAFGCSTSFEIEIMDGGTFEKVVDANGNEIEELNGDYWGVISKNSTVTVIASEKQNKKFVSWSTDEEGLEVLSEDNPYTFKVTQKLTIWPVYRDLYIFDLEVVGGTFKGTGSTGGSTGKGTVKEDSMVTIEHDATKAPQGKRFTHWEVDGVLFGSTASYSFQMDKSYTITACYEAIPTYTVTVISNGDTIIGGDILSSQGNVYTFYEGAIMKMWALAGQGQVFESWVVNGTNPVINIFHDFKVTANTTVNANFKTAANSKPAPLANSGTGPDGEIFVSGSNLLNLDRLNGAYAATYTGGGTYAGGNMFNLPDVDYVRIYFYGSAEATQPLGSFMVRAVEGLGLSTDHNNRRLEIFILGTNYIPVQATASSYTGTNGNNVAQASVKDGNYYIGGEIVCPAMAYIMGIDVAEMYGYNFYFACQVVTKIGSELGASGISGKTGAHYGRNFYNNTVTAEWNTLLQNLKGDWDARA